MKRKLFLVILTRIYINLFLNMFINRRKNYKTIKNCIIKKRLISTLHNKPIKDQGQDLVTNYIFL